jgi:glycosyltransferase involved in cell wall biosynthesis
MWPDNGLGWAPFALVAGLRVVRRDRPDVLYSTSAPYSAHLVALVIAWLTSIPWVADFRDEWAANPRLVGQPRALTALAASAECAITARARRVVVAAGYFQLAGLAPDDPRRVEIVNGVDEADLPVASALRPPADRFVLAHVGTLYDIQDLSPVLRALAALAARGAIDADLVDVRLVGSFWLQNFAPPAGIHVQKVGYVKHARAVAEIHAATALLLYVSGSSLAPSGKRFEYLASGRPVLCVARPENLASRLVLDWDAGVVADPGDQSAIEHAISALWRRWQVGGLGHQAHVRARTLERYSRRANATRLPQVLEEARSG